MDDRTDGTPLLTLDGQVAVSRVAPERRLVLRGEPQAIADICEQWNCIAPQPCRSVTAGAFSALWLGPDEWLLIWPADNAGFDRASLESALTDGSGSLTDVSYRDLSFDIEGPSAALLLNAAIALDLDESTFPVGMCCRTAFAKIGVLLWRRGATSYQMSTGRSFAPYLIGMLREAARDLAD